MKLVIDIKGVQNKEMLIMKKLKQYKLRGVPKVTIDSNGKLFFTYEDDFLFDKMIVKQANKKNYKHINEFLQKFYNQHANSNRVWMLYKVIESENDWLIFFIIEY